LPIIPEVQAASASVEAHASLCAARMNHLHARFVARLIRLHHVNKDEVAAIKAVYAGRAAHCR
jgi:hypothetical protein